MKARVKLHKTNGVNKKGEYPVILLLEHRQARKKKTIAYSSLEYWDEAKQLPDKKHLQYFDLYSMISSMRIVAESLEFKRHTNVVAAMDLFFEKEVVTESDFDFYEWVEVRRKYMLDQGREGNAEAYKNAKKQFKNFKPNLYWGQINTTFIENFKVYKKKDKVKNSTLRAYISSFMAIYKAGIKLKGLPNNAPFFGVFDDLQISKRRVKNVYLDKKDLKVLEGSDLKRKACQRAVDLTLLQFYLGGCDFIELCYIKKSDYANGRVWFKRKKRGDLAYEFDVKVFEKARLLIEKYKVVEGEYLFPWAYVTRERYVSFRRMQNRLMQDALDLLEIRTKPLNDTFTTKSIRHTFQTLGKFEYVEADIIRELVGHERFDMDTVYKDKYPEAVRDAGHLKIIDTSEIEIKKNKLPISKI